MPGHEDGECGVAAIGRDPGAARDTRQRQRGTLLEPRVEQDRRIRRDGTAARVETDAAAGGEIDALTIELRGFPPVRRFRGEAAVGLVRARMSHEEEWRDRHGHMR